jgi:hydrogenase-4 component F
LTKPVLFFAAGNIHQQFHALDFRGLGCGLLRSMPVTGVLLGLAAVAVSGLPPFGLFASEMTVLAGGFRSHQAVVSVVMLAALIVVFCGVLGKLAGLLLGPANPERAREHVSACTVAAMSLPLGTLLLFSAWLPGPIRELMDQASAIIRGAP